MINGTCSTDNLSPFGAVLLAILTKWHERTGQQKSHFVNFVFSQLAGRSTNFDCAKNNEAISGKSSLHNQHLSLILVLMKCTSALLCSPSWPNDMKGQANKKVILPNLCLANLLVIRQTLIALKIMKLLVAKAAYTTNTWVPSSFWWNAPEHCFARHLDQMTINGKWKDRPTKKSFCQICV